MEVLPEDEERVQDTDHVLAAEFAPLGSQGVFRGEPLERRVDAVLNLEVNVLKTLQNALLDILVLLFLLLIFDMLDNFLERATAAVFL